MADPRREEGGEEPIQVPRKTKLPLVIGALAVVGASAGSYLALRPTARSADKETKRAAEDSGTGVVVALTPFIVNLADEDTISYLKCTVAVELSDKELAPVLERKSAQVRNTVIMYLSSLTLGDTKTTQNKEKILAELSKRITEVLGEGAITRVYLTEFVIQ